MGAQKDTQAAINACFSLYHFRERLPEPIQPAVNALLTRCPDYGLVRDVTNISKHVTLTYYVPIITAIKEILVITKFKDDEGEYTNSEKLVEVEL